MGAGLDILTTICKVGWLVCECMCSPPPESTNTKVASADRVVKGRSSSDNKEITIFGNTYNSVEDVPRWSLEEFILEHDLRTQEEMDDYLTKEQLEEIVCDYLDK